MKDTEKRLQRLEEILKNHSDPRIERLAKFPHVSDAEVSEIRRQAEQSFFEAYGERGVFENISDLKILELDRMARAAGYGGL